MPRNTNGRHALAHLLDPHVEGQIHAELERNRAKLREETDRLGLLGRTVADLRVW